MYGRGAYNFGRHYYTGSFLLLGYNRRRSSGSELRSTYGRSSLRHPRIWVHFSRRNGVAPAKDKSNVQAMITRRALIIGVQVIRIMAREIMKTLGTGRTGLWFLIGSMLLLGGALSFMLAASVSSELEDEILASFRHQILQTTLASSMLSTCLLTVILTLVSPARTELQRLLDMLPVNAMDVRIGQLLPSLGLANGASLALSSATIAVAWGSRSNLATFTLTMLSLVVSILTMETLSFGLVILLTRASRAMKLPSSIATFMAASIVIIFGIAQSAFDILTPTFRTSESFQWMDALLLNRTWAGLVSNPMSIEYWAGIVAWILVSSVVAVVASRWKAPSAQIEEVPIGRNLRFPRGVLWASSWLKLLLLLRRPQTIMVVGILPVGIVLVSRLLDAPVTHLLGVAAAMSLPVMPMFISVYAVGRTRQITWLNRHIVVTMTSWITSKLFAYGAFGVVVGGITLAIEVRLGQLGINAVPNVALHAGTALAAGLLGGSIIPVSDSQPLSTAAASCVSSLLYIAPSSAVNWMGSILGSNFEWLGAGIVLTFYLFSFVQVSNKPF